MKTPARYSWMAPLISGTVVLLCLVYCRIWWTPRPMTLVDPDESIICWMFCRTMSNVWFSLGALCALSSMTGGVMARSDMKAGKILALIGGILTVPIGIMNFISFYVSKKDIH